MGWVELISQWTIPVLVAFIPLYGYLKGVRIYDAFIEGAEEGFWLTVKIIPYIVSIFAALAIFRESGAMYLLVDLLTPLLVLLNIPSEIIPLAIVRPLSGGGSLGLTLDLLRQYGPDSYVGRLASTMQGSTETTFYIITFYFGAVGINKIRYAIPVGLAGDVAGFLVSVLVVQLIFGH